MTKIDDLLIYLCLRGMNAGKPMSCPARVADVGLVDRERRQAAERLIFELYGESHWGFQELIEARRRLDDRHRSSRELYTAASVLFVRGDIERAIGEFSMRGSSPSSALRSGNPQARTARSSNQGVPAPLLSGKAVTPAMNVFLCYAKGDTPLVQPLFDRLREAGHDAWMDIHKLVLGDEWEREIRRAVLSADAFVVCLSTRFNETGFRQQEVHWAVDAWRHRPPGTGFIIPFRLEPCELPDWVEPLHAGRDLSRGCSVDELLAAVAKHAVNRRPRRSA